MKFTKSYNQAHSESHRFKIRTEYQYAIFHKKNQAEEFIDQLNERYGIKADIFQKQSTTTSSTHTSYWDIIPQYGKAFTVQFLSRLYGKGVPWETFCDQPIDIRLRELQEYLYFMAVRDGGWHELIYTNNELKWYQEFAKLTDSQIKQAVQRSKALYASSREKEKRLSLGVGGGLILLSLLLFAVQQDISIWALLSFSFGSVFIVFSLFRHKQSSN